jgi:transcriptional regulator with XRE-family HTH domain
MGKGAGSVEIGAKIRCLRLARSLTQEELADRCELSKGFISQLERDTTSPSIATLMDILQALGTDLRQFFSEDRDAKTVFSHDDFAVKTEEDSGRETVWLVPDAQRNRMEPILVTLAAGASTLSDDPHEGEEFGYVLEGAVWVVTGGGRTRARRGDSFLIHPSEPHRLENPGRRPARVLWVSTPPSF